MGNKHGTRMPAAQGRKKSADVREKSSIFASAAKGKTYDYLYKVVFVGDCDTGKSSVSLWLGREDFSNVYIPTIGFDFKVLSVSLDELRCKLQVWDTAGQERFRTITRAYYPGALGFVIFYDALRQKTFDNVPYWIEEARQHGHPDATLMLVGTKCDRSEEKVVAYETAKDFADENDILFFEVSAKDDTNIELAVLSLVAEIRCKHREHEVTPDDSVV